MRPALFIAAGIAVAISGQALAANQNCADTSNMPVTEAPMQSSGQGSQTDATTDSASPPTTSASAADASASGSAAAAISVGEPVKDNTGATIGAISSLSTAANGQQMAVIKMGNDSFQVPGDRLGVTNGAAVINLSQAQIASMIHPPAGGR